MTELEPLAAHVAGLRVGSMPDDVRASARLHVLDSLAAALAAVGSDVHRALAPVAHDDAAAIASTGAALAHRWELDDIDDATLLCLGGLVVPVAVALGRERRASGPETLAAVVAGYEAAGRLGRALRSADLLRRG
ncbi:MAG: MmgE/PrpD family protein, partial [Chloroflexota bacterium]|nr:MmgE/PrpD family protein [Chloroflexota bacterium]